MLRHLTAWLSLVAIVVGLVMPTGCTLETPARAANIHVIAGASQDAPPHQDLDDTDPGDCEDLCACPSCPTHGMLQPTHEPPRPAVDATRVNHTDKPDDVYVSDVIGGVFHPPKSRQISA